MKEIGLKLKEARESIGISIEEAAEDLKIRPSQIENLEQGNNEAFSDLFYLKYFIRDYAKYLGLDKEDLVDEFNEYLFDYTSKLSLDDIKNAKKGKVKTKRIKSPYTMDHKSKLSWLPFVIYGVIVVLIITIAYVVINLNTEDEDFVEGAVVETGK